MTNNKVPCPLCGQTNGVRKDGTRGQQQAWRHEKCPERKGKAHYYKTPLNATSTTLDCRKTYISEEELRSRHDMFYKLLQTLQGFEQGKFIEEADLLKMIGIHGKPGYRQIIDKAEIKQYKGKADGTTYYGHPESIERLRQEGVLL